MSHEENKVELTIEGTTIDLNYASSKKSVAGLGSSEKPLPKITIDGKVVEFNPGDTIMQVAERANISDEIPRFCYHPGMPIAGSCRMCTVEVEKMPKLTTSCSTPAADGMIVHTNSERVKKSRNGVIEFLLTNHPLDCPVCDKAGECELQDYNFEYGPSKSNFKEAKRVWKDSTTKLLSDKITLNMNRCVHCERCVRFTEDVTKTSDLVMLNRGWHKELAPTDEDRGLWNDYQGCLTDFCPVGALTFNDFRFNKRVWFLKKKPSICDLCSKGCNIEAHEEKEIIYRYIPQFNEKVNQHWMCDEGRVSYHTTTSPMRIISPMVQSLGQNSRLAATSWGVALEEVKKLLKGARKPTLIIGTDATNEEVAFLEKNKNLLHSDLEIFYHNGTNNVLTSQDDKKLDHLLRMNDRTPNTRGLEAQGLTPYLVSNNIDVVIYYRSGRAALPEFPENTKIILWGVWLHEEIDKLAPRISALLPGLTTAEKSGSFINCDGIKQNFSAAVTHQAEAKSVESFFENFSQPSSTQRDESWI